MRKNLLVGIGDFGGFRKILGHGWKVNQGRLILATACKIYIFSKIIDCSRICKLVERKRIGTDWGNGAVKVGLASIFTIVVEEWYTYMQW